MFEKVIVEKHFLELKSSFSKLYSLEETANVERKSVHYIKLYTDLLISSPENLILKYYYRFYTNEKYTILWHCATFIQHNAECIDLMEHFISIYLKQYWEKYYCLKRHYRYIKLMEQKESSGMIQWNSEANDRKHLIHLYTETKFFLSEGTKWLKKILAYFIIHKK